MEEIPKITDITLQPPQNLDVSIEESDEMFLQKLEEMRSFLRLNNINPAPKSPEELSVLEEKLKQTEGGEKLIEGIKSLMLEVANLAVVHDANLYLAFQYFETLGLKNRIKERVDKGCRTESGELYYDLTLASLEYGSDDQAENVLREWVTDKQRGDFPEAFQGTKYFKERLPVIREAYKEFAQKNNLPDSIVNMGGLNTTDLINAAIELKKMNYDVVIGVLKSGIHVATIMDFLGQNTRFIEWHKHWKSGPRLKKIGSDISPITSAQKILICEQDAHTGATLNALIPFIEKLNPEKVDVSFWIDEQRQNQAKIDESNYYDEQFLVGKIPFNHLVENLNSMVAYSKDYLTKNTSK